MAFHLYEDKVGKFLFYFILLNIFFYQHTVLNMQLTGSVEEAGLIAGVVDPLLTVHRCVGQSGDLIPGGVPVVDVGDVRFV